MAFVVSSSLDSFTLPSASCGSSLLPASACHLTVAWTPAMLLLCLGISVHILTYWLLASSLIVPVFPLLLDLLVSQFWKAKQPGLFWLTTCVFIANLLKARVLGASQPGYNTPAIYCVGLSNKMMKAWNLSVLHKCWTRHFVRVGFVFESTGIASVGSSERIWCLWGQVLTYRTVVYSFHLCLLLE